MINDFFDFDADYGNRFLREQAVNEAVTRLLGVPKEQVVGRVEEVDFDICFTAWVEGIDETGEHVIAPTTYKARGWDVPNEVDPFFRKLRLIPQV